MPGHGIGIGGLTGAGTEGIGWAMGGIGSGNGMGSGTGVGGGTGSSPKGTAPAIGIQISCPGIMRFGFVI